MLLRRTFILLAIGLLSACATPRTLTESQEDDLVRRATDRWEAIVERDFSDAYELTSPAYRAVFTEAMYRTKFSYMLEWELTSVELVHYDARAAVASVAVRVMSRPVKQTSAASAAIGAVPTRFVEQWILEDGQWWYSATL
ncbi:MAG: hypothetical protein Cons2KO_06940 [Congregibacter sp.]